jgi:alpha-amylase
VPTHRAAFCALLAVIVLAPAAEAKDRHRHDGPQARHSLREPLTREHYYFVMADRFANGDTANDRGGLDGDRSRHGFDDTDRRYYHGGDLKGVIDKLDYIKRMGTTAIWLTPSFKNRPVQGVGDTESAGYHGYWITDFTQIDPHLGTNADLERLIAGAHARGMKVFFDIITNHTADVIDYVGGDYSYITKQERPYRDASGNVFDDRDYAGTGNFPALDPAISFPYQPFDEEIKVPGWLNDETLYHNRGNAKFDGGESDLYGDFFGLDDLFTEHPRVVQGMIDIYKMWVRDFGVDGFRIDTVKHVNPEFWRAFVPEVLAEAHRAGKRDFFMFGEVFSADQKFLSQFLTDQKLQAVIDFAFQDTARSFASKSGATNQLRKLFVNDDYFTDADSNVYQSPTFLGNHDMGRIGFFIDQDNPGASDAERLARDRLAHQLMFLARGMPVVYYGDEQGFTGSAPGNDQLARQDMFPSRTQEYWDDDSIGTTETPKDDNFDPSHPLYREIAQLSSLTKRHPALRDGAQQHRFSSTSAGIYAFSRIDAERQREYVVALNNSETPQTAAIPTYSDRKHFKRLYGEGAKHVRSDGDAALTLTVPALSAVVYEAAGRVERSRRAPGVDIAVLGGDDKVRGRFPITTEVDGDSFYETTYWVKAGNVRDWTLVGTDDNAPYRVFYDASPHAPQTSLTFRAVLRDNAGHVSSDQRTVEVDVPAPPPESLPRQTRAIVHYQRPNGDYDGWGLHLWGSALAAHEYPSEWFDENTPERFDAFGAVFELDLVNDLERVNFITHRDDDKDGGDRSFLPRTEPEIWLVQGDPEVYTEPPPE